jgi:hypothetical protein
LLGVARLWLRLWEDRAHTFMTISACPAQRATTLPTRWPGNMGGSCGVFAARERGSVHLVHLAVRTLGSHELAIWAWPASCGRLLGLRSARCCRLLVCQWPRPLPSYAVLPGLPSSPGRACRRRQPASAQGGAACLPPASPFSPPPGIDADAAYHGSAVGARSRRPVWAMSLLPLALAALSSGAVGTARATSAAVCSGRRYSFLVERCSTRTTVEAKLLAAPAL